MSEGRYAAFSSKDFRMVDETSVKFNIANFCSASIATRLISMIDTRVISFCERFDMSTKLGQFYFKNTAYKKNRKNEFVTLHHSVTCILLYYHKCKKSNISI